MMKKAAGMGWQDRRAGKEALLVAEYYEAKRQMDEGQDKLAKMSDPTDCDVIFLLSGAVRRYERAIAAINSAGIGERVFDTGWNKGVVHAKTSGNVCSCIGENRQKTAIYEGIS